MWDYFAGRRNNQCVTYFLLPERIVDHRSCRHLRLLMLGAGGDGHENFKFPKCVDFPINLQRKSHNFHKVS